MPQSDARFLMRTPIKRPSGADWCRIESKKAADKTVGQVFIYDEIGYFGTTAADFIRAMNELEVDEIEVHINSPGGDVFDGVAIHSAIKAKAKDMPVKIVVDSLAASAASFIAQAGDEIFMARNATMMIHDASGFAFGPAAVMAKQATILDQVSDNIADIYSQGNDTPAEEWRALMKEEVWYNGQEAVDAGLATAVIDQEDKEAEEASANWDFSVFNHAGRSNAPHPERVRQMIRFAASKEPSMTQPNSNGATEENPPAGATGDGQPIPEGNGNLDPNLASPDTADDNTGGEPTTPADGAEATRPETTNVLTPVTGAPVQFVVNGQPITDLVAVQRHITVLETSLKESADAGRRAFVVKLADDKKIAAPQIEGLQNFVEKLDNSAYDAWKGTWDLAPVNPLFAQHGGAASTSSQSPTKASDEIDVLTATVENLRRSGLNDEQIKQTPSFQKLALLRQPTT